MKAQQLGWGLLAMAVPMTSLAEPTKPVSPPEEAVVLTVKGDITYNNVNDAALFDLAMLEALPQHEFSTSTPWTSGVNHYSGPLMSTLLEHLGSEGESVHVAALNGYEADIPVSDFDDYDVILAIKCNGEAIPIREFGPLWVLYPFDEDDALRSERMRLRAIWQVMEMNVE